MEWTYDQLNAINIALDNYHHNRPFTFISGVAGSGKTTILLEIINQLHIDINKVRCLTFTGKASQVLDTKGLPNTGTIHGFLYYPVLDDYDHIIDWAIKPYFDRDNIQLLVIDEVSMVPRNIWNDLLRLRIPILCTGDIAQLPPVDKSNLINWRMFYSNRPHYVEGDLACDYHMTQITRQSANSDIIKQSLLVRNYGATRVLSQRNYQSDEVSIISMDQVTPELLLNADVVITATNHTRKLMNRVIRKLRYPNLSEAELLIPQQDDVIICLANKWQILSTGGSPIINGLRGILTSYTTREISSRTQGTILRMTANFAGNESRRTTLHNPLNMFCGISLNYYNLLDKPLTKTDLDKLGHPLSVDYGYVLSCHKSQGSEWDNVVILEETWPNGPLRDKWWYTALTRAKSKVTIITLN